MELCDGLETIEVDALSRCASLRHISIPSTVFFIDGGAFGCCSQLNTIELCDVDIDISWAFHNCPSLRNVAISSNNQSKLNVDGCHDLVRALGICQGSIQQALHDQCVDLPTHHACYYQSHMCPYASGRVIKDTISSQSLSNMESNNAALQDCLGMTPLHIGLLDEANRLLQCILLASSPRMHGAVFHSYMQFGAMLQKRLYNI